MDIDSPARRSKARVPAKALGTDDVMRIFEACQAIER
jgi:hypothetical protein